MAGQTGRPPEPYQLKLLKSSRPGYDSGGRKLKPPPGFQRVPPKPPSWLSREAAAEWRRVVPELTRLDLLKEADRSLLVAYCETWARFVEATRVIQVEGLTHEPKQGTLARPEVAIARNAARELRSFASIFGLGPAYEARVRPAGADDDQDDNPFAGPPA